MTNLPEESAPPPLDMDELKRRRKSSARVIALLLVGLVVLIYLITLTRIGVPQ
ncbi:MAG: hypothetical protein RIS52_2013 [Pseudomonadota bacterium]|jgi:hypothetical protein